MLLFIPHQFTAYLLLSGISIEQQGLHYPYSYMALKPVKFIYHPIFTRTCKFQRLEKFISPALLLHFEDQLSRFRILRSIEPILQVLLKLQQLLFSRLSRREDLFHSNAHFNTMAEGADSVNCSHSSDSEAQVEKESAGMNFTLIQLF